MKKIALIACLMLICSFHCIADEDRPNTLVSMFNVVSIKHIIGFDKNITRGGNQEGTFLVFVIHTTNGKMNTVRKLRENLY